MLSFLFFPLVFTVTWLRKDSNKVHMLPLVYIFLRSVLILGSSAIYLSFFLSFSPLLAIYLLKKLDHLSLRVSISLVLAQCSLVVSCDIYIYFCFLYFPQTGSWICTGLIQFRLDCLARILHAQTTTRGTSNCLSFYDVKGCWWAIPRFINH